MSRVRGSKRKELIEKWLNGEEDEEYEVKPTRTEGKFIIRKRNESNNESNNESEQEEDIKQEDESNQSVTDNTSDKQSNQHSNQSNQHSAANSNQQHKSANSNRNKRVGENETLNQILEQLRLLGEQQKQREERKQRKRETKAAILKQLSYMNPIRNTNTEVFQQSNQQSDDSDNESQSISQASPTYVRRRLNLLNNHR